MKHLRPISYFAIIVIVLLLAVQRRNYQPKPSFRQNYAPPPAADPCQADNRDYLLGWYKMNKSETIIAVLKNNGTYYAPCRGFEVPLKPCPEGLEWDLAPSSMVGTKIGFAGSYFIAVKDQQLMNNSDQGFGTGEKQHMTRIDKPSCLLEAKAKAPRTNDDFIGWYIPVWFPYVQWHIQKKGEKYILTYQELQEPGQWKAQGEPKELIPLSDRLGFTGFDRKNEENLIFNEELGRFELAFTTSNINMPLARLDSKQAPDSGQPDKLINIGIPSWH